MVTSHDYLFLTNQESILNHNGPAYLLLTNLGSTYLASYWSYNYLFIKNEGGISLPIGQDYLSK